MSATKKSPAALRRYVPSPLRRLEILDAAFAEFSDASYDGTTIEQIATRAGLSKAGVYAHFSTKEEIFYALMERLLIPGLADWNWLPTENVDLVTFVDGYVDHLYTTFKNPAFLKALRLVVTESARMPEAMKQWQESTDAALRKSHQAFIEGCVARGIVRPDSVLTEQFWPLAIAPFSLWILMSMMGVHVSISLEQARAATRRQILELLEPR